MAQYTFTKLPGGVLLQDASTTPAQFIGFYSGAVTLLPAYDDTNFEINTGIPPVFTIQNKDVLYINGMAPPAGAKNICQNLASNIFPTGTSVGTGGTTSSPTLTVATKTTNYTVLATDGLLNVDTTAGNVTITLRNASVQNTLLTIKKIAGANNVIVAAPTGTIEGATTATLKAIGAAIDVFSDGTNYFIK